MHGWSPGHARKQQAPRRAPVVFPVGEAARTVRPVTRTVFAEPTAIRGARPARAPGPLVDARPALVGTATPACCQRCGQAKVEGYLQVHEACSPRRFAARHRGLGGAPAPLEPGSVAWIAESSRQLAVHGYKQLHMSAGGGNSCLACSISYQCTGSEEHHGRFRAAAVQHETLEAAFFSLKVAHNATLAEHVTALADGNTAMDEMDVLAFSEWTQRPIAVWREVTPGRFVFWQVQPDADRVRAGHDGNKPIRVFYTFRDPCGHYDAIVPLTTDDEGGNSEAAMNARSDAFACRPIEVEAFFAAHPPGLRPPGLDGQFGSRYSPQRPAADVFADLRGRLHKEGDSLSHTGIDGPESFFRAVGQCLCPSELVTAELQDLLQRACDEVCRLTATDQNAGVIPRPVIFRRADAVSFLVQRQVQLLDMHRQQSDGRAREATGRCSGDGASDERASATGGKCHGPAGQASSYRLHGFPNPVQTGVAKCGQLGAPCCNQRS